MNFIEAHCPTPPPAADPNRKRSPRHRRTTPSSSPKSAMGSTTTSPSISPRGTGGSSNSSGGGGGGGGGGGSNTNSNSIRWGASGNRDWHVPSPRRSPKSRNDLESKFSSPSERDRGNDKLLPIGLKKIEKEKKPALATIGVHVRRAPSPRHIDDGFNHPENQTSRHGSPEALRPIASSARVRSTSPQSMLLPPSSPPAHPTNIVEITHDHVFGATTTIRELSLESVPLEKTLSSGSSSSSKDRFGSLEPLDVSGNEGSDGRRSSHSVFRGSNSNRDSRTSQTNSSHKSYSPTIQTKRSHSPPVKLAKLRGMTNTERSPTNKINGTGLNMRSDGTIPIMPAMGGEGKSDAAAQQSKKLDYGKFLSPVKNANMFNTDSPKNLRRSNVSPTFRGVPKTIMPGIHNSPTESSRAVVVQQEVEW